MTSKQILKRYKTYSQQVQDWMNNLIEELYNEIGDIPNSYIMQLDMLADACDILVKSKKEIDDNGLVVEDSRHGKVKNSACAIWNSANLTINKLLNQLIMTRSAKSKLKNIDIDEESPIDEFI